MHFRLKLRFRLGEESVELGVDHVRNLLKIFRTVTELHVVGIYDQEIALVFAYPLLILLVETGQIVDAYALLVVTPPLLNLRDEIRN